NHAVPNRVNRLALVCDQIAGSVLARATLAISAESSTSGVEAVLRNERQGKGHRTDSYGESVGAPQQEDVHVRRVMDVTPGSRAEQDTRQSVPRRPSSAMARPSTSGSPPPEWCLRSPRVTVIETASSRERSSVGPASLTTPSGIKTAAACIS